MGQVVPSDDANNLEEMGWGGIKKRAKCERAKLLGEILNSVSEVERGFPIP